MTTSFALEIPADVHRLADARHGVRQWLADEGLDPETAGDLLAVASEFLLHAIVRTGGTGTVRLVGQRRPDGVRLTVEASAADEGTPRRLHLPDDPLAAGALGRRMVEECCDDVQIATSGAEASAACWRGVA